jgi:DNA topoisomerase I
VSQGDKFRVIDVSVEEKFDQRPPRYNQSTLLEKMEKEGIGTKATRADIIATLVERGYVAGEGMEATDLGLSVVETLSKYAPSIMSTRLTKGIEEKLEAVEGGTEREGGLLRETVRSLAEQLTELSANEEDVGEGIDSALVSAVGKSYVLGKCPACTTGQLRIVRSKTSKKRFAGCTNYPVCRTSAPLPQRGIIKATPRECRHCRWPVVLVGGGGRPWRLCVNPDCPEKREP